MLLDRRVHAYAPLPWSRIYTVSIEGDQKDATHTNHTHYASTLGKYTAHHVNGPRLLQRASPVHKE